MQPFVANAHHVVTIQAFTESRNDYGEPVKAWADVTTRRAMIEALQGRELWAAQQALAEVTHRVTLRYYTGLTTQHRLLFGTRVFEIDSIIVPDEKKQWMQLICKERPE